MNLQVPPVIIRNRYLIDKAVVLSCPARERGGRENVVVE